jgi:hypothetical protein
MIMRRWNLPYSRRMKARIKTRLLCQDKPSFCTAEGTESVHAHLAFTEKERRADLVALLATVSMTPEMNGAKWIDVRSSGRFETLVEGVCECGKHFLRRPRVARRLPHNWCSTKCPWRKAYRA